MRKYRTIYTIVNGVLVKIISANTIYGSGLFDNIYWVARQKISWNKNGKKYYFYASQDLDKNIEFSRKYIKRLLTPRIREAMELINE